MSADDVIGYLTTCEACGGRALTLHQHGADWRCPSCTEFAATQPVPVPSENVAFQMFDPLAGAIQREVLDRPDQAPRVIARVGDQCFMLCRFDARDGRFVSQWMLEPDQDKQLAPWADEDSESTPTRAPVKLPAEFDTPNGLAALLRHHGLTVEFERPPFFGTFGPYTPSSVDDGEYPVGQVQG